MKSLDAEKNKINDWRQDLQKRLQGMHAVAIVKRYDLQESPGSYCFMKAGFRTRNRASLNVVAEQLESNHMEAKESSKRRPKQSSNAYVCLRLPDCRCLGHSVEWASEAATSTSFCNRALARKSCGQLCHTTRLGHWV